jgi:hypothetical protein
MVRGAFIQRATDDRLTVAAAMKYYFAGVVPSKRPQHGISLLFHGRADIAPLR